MTRLALAIALGAAGLVTLAPRRAVAGPLTGIGGGGLGPGFARSMGEATDLGPEVTLLESVTEDASATAIGVDFVFAIYLDQAVTIQRSLDSVQGVKDRLLGKPIGRSWPFLSHQAIAVHVGGVFDLEGGRAQGHLAVGSGVGAIGIALAATYEVIEGPDALGLGPELRLRHRFGPTAHAASVGVLLRAEVYAYEREAHPDRLTLGLFGMWGW